MPVSQQLSAFDYESSTNKNVSIKNITAAYSVSPSDNGWIINCTAGTFTIALPSSTSLAIASGFNCWVWNTGDGTVTLDPAGSETIDGTDTTYILRPRAGVQIVYNGAAWITGDVKAYRLYQESSPTDANYTRPIASGFGGIALCSGAQATGQSAISIGQNSYGYGILTTAVGPSAQALGTDSSTFGSNSYASSAASRGLALGYAQVTSANGTAIGVNSTPAYAVSAGSGAVSIGGSYASGTNSFAAAIANNTSTYGATGANSVAIGSTAKASGASAFALGTLAVADATDSMAFGDSAVTNGIIGKYAFGSGNSSYVSSFLLLRNQTTDATPTTLTSQAAAASTTSQLVLPNSSAYVFTGTVVARQQASGGTASAAWKVEGLIRREANAASTTLVASTVTAIDNTPGWTLALSADTTNGGLKVEATGAASTNIRWVATIYTSEVTYA